MAQRLVALCVDSSIFIEAERRHYRLSTIVALADDEEPLAMAALTISELLLGVHLSAPSAERNFREAFIEEVIENFAVLDFDLSVARLYARTWAELRREGNLIAPHDLLIGSTALFHGYDILTHNVRDFGRINGLRVRQPGW